MTPTTAPATPRLDPLALMSALVLEDGRPWGEAAHPWQRADAEAILEPDGARRHYLLRGRGMSKTTDVAAAVLALLLAEAPPRSRSLVFAVDTDQAGLFVDALAGLVQRTPGLAGAVDVGARGVTVKATGAALSVESSDGASAFGARPWLTVADELALWPSTANHRRLWSAIVSAVPKVPGARLIVSTTAGSPTGLGAEVWAEAEASPHWRASRHPGPSPWWTPADIDALTGSLTAAEYRRLILCEWAEGDDTLTTADDVLAAIRPGAATLAPRPGVEYVAALDVGTRRDLTALVVGHAERREHGRVVVVDRALYWRPTTAARRGGTSPEAIAGRVDLAEVEAATLALAREYRVARLRFDRMQAEQLSTNLARAGIVTQEFVFSSAGANRLARALAGALRDRGLELPDDDEVRAEFTTARLVETGPGVVKIANPPGTHDDLVQAVGMLVVDLAEQPETGGGRITVPTGRISDRRRPSRLTANRDRLALALREASRNGPRIPGGALLVPGSGNDPQAAVRDARESWGGQPVLDGGR